MQRLKGRKRQRTKAWKTRGHAHRLSRDRPPCGSASSRFRHAPTSYVAFASDVAVCRGAGGIYAAWRAGSGDFLVSPDRPSCYPVGRLQRKQPAWHVPLIRDNACNFLLTRLALFRISLASRSLYDLFSLSAGFVTKRGRYEHGGWFACGGVGGGTLATLSLLDVPSRRTSATSYRWHGCARLACMLFETVVERRRTHRETAPEVLVAADRSEVNCNRVNSFPLDRSRASRLEHEEKDRPLRLAPRRLCRAGGTADLIRSSRDRSQRGLSEKRATPVYTRQRERKVTSAGSKAFDARNWSYEGRRLKAIDRSSNVQKTQR